MNIISAEEARKIAREVRNNRELSKARQFIAKNIKRSVNEGRKELEVFNYQKLDVGIWQELKDLGYILTKKEVEYLRSNECMAIRWD